MQTQLMAFKSSRCQRVTGTPGHPESTARNLAGEKKELSQITECVLTNHIKVEEKPELKKITAFIFPLIWHSGTVRAAVRGAANLCTNEQLSHRRQSRAHTAGQGDGSQGHLGTLGRAQTPRNTSANFATSAYAVSK